MVIAEIPHALRRGPTVFLKAVVVLVGVGAIAALLGEPLTEGRNAHATLVQVYFHDPFLAYVYVAAIPFFTALVQAFTLLGYAARGQTISPAAVRAVRTVKRCAFLTAGAIIAADVYLRIAAHFSHDDPAGAMMLGMVAILAAIVVGAAAAILQRVLQNAVDLKLENDLTV